jgi:hypothetical protein
MAYEYKEGRGMLFVNTDKKTDKHPDRNGSFKLDGKLYRISGWIQKDDAGAIKKDRDGNPMLSLQVQLAGDTQSKSTKTLSEDMGGEEIPF